MSLYPPLSTIPISEHIIEKDGSKIISTGDAVKFGEMSFRMITDDPFDIEGFKLKENTYYIWNPRRKAVIHVAEIQDLSPALDRVIDGGAKWTKISDLDKSESDL